MATECTVFPMTNTNTNRAEGPGKEATMATNLRNAKATVVADNNLRPEVASWPASRILSALGHPGYGRAHSEDVILRMAERHCSAWDAGVMWR